MVVLTGLGLRGSPGMGLTSALMFAIDGAGLSASVAVITDGQMSGLVNGGLVIAEVSPEGAAGGPLGLVRDGDLIAIDVNARTVDLEVEPGELAARRAALPPLAAGGRSTRGAARRWDPARPWGADDTEAVHGRKGTGQSLAAGGARRLRRTGGSRGGPFDRRIWI